MVEACGLLDMKPVCEHPSYCGSDREKSLYIGQASHLSYSPYRNINSWFPSGFAPAKSLFYRQMTCYYSGNNRGNALCNVPINSHGWYYPSNTPTLRIMCGKREGGVGGNFEAAFGSGKGAANFTFVPARPSLVPSLCTHFTRAGIEWRR